MKQDYLEIQRKLSEILGLKFPPVAISLIRRACDIPQGVPELDKPMFYCAMVKYAMLGNVFYAREDTHSCKRGAAALGLCSTPEDERTGEFYTSKSSFSSPRAAVRTVKQSPQLDAGSVYATLLSPLDKTLTDPDVVLIEAIPRRALEIVQAALFERGGWVEGMISAPRQVCAALTVRPYLGHMNVSIACESARIAAKPTGLEYSDDGVLIGIPGEIIGDIANNIDRIGYIRLRLTKK
jgi:uncharacterized protein (DUF169 family)